MSEVVRAKESRRPHPGLGASGLLSGSEPERPADTCPAAATAKRWARVGSSASGRPGNCPVIRGAGWCTCPRAKNPPTKAAPLLRIFSGLRSSGEHPGLCAPLRSGRHGIHSTLIGSTSTRQPRGKVTSPRRGWGSRPRTMIDAFTPCCLAARGPFSTPGSAASRMSTNLRCLCRGIRRPASNCFLGICRGCG